MKRTIIYVFGPKRLASLYFANKGTGAEKWRLAENRADIIFR